MQDAVDYIEVYFAPEFRFVKLAICCCHLGGNNDVGAYSVFSIPFGHIKSDHVRRHVTAQKHQIEFTDQPVIRDADVDLAFFGDCPPFDANQGYFGRFLNLRQSFRADRDPFLQVSYADFHFPVADSLSYCGRCRRGDG